jgi:hypothetical protein
VCEQLPAEQTKRNAAVAAAALKARARAKKKTNKTVPTKLTATVAEAIVATRSVSRVYTPGRFNHACLFQHHACLFQHHACLCQQSRLLISTISLAYINNHACLCQQSRLLISTITLAYINDHACLYRQSRLLISTIKLANIDRYSPCLCVATKQRLLIHSFFFVYLIRNRR